MFFRLLMESFRRQRRRKLLAGIAILLGTTAVTAMLALATTIGDRIHKELAVYGANIVIYPKADLLDVKIGGVDIKPTTGGAYLHESDLARLKTIFWANNITGVSPELPFHIYTGSHNAGAIDAPALGLWFHHSLSGGSSSTVITGAEQLHPLWRIEGHWPNDSSVQQQSSEVVVGSSLATRGGWKVGDQVVTALPFSGLGAPPMIPRAYSLRIIGIAKGDSAIENLFLLPLKAAQILTNLPDAVSRVEVSARTKPEDAFARVDPDTLPTKQREIWYCRPYANSIAYQIREAIPGADAQQLRRVEQSEGTILSRIGGLMWLISAAALFAAGFAVSAAMATAILERRAEIGLMRSLGASKGTIALLFYAETGLLSIVAGSAGYLIGSSLAAWLGARIFSGEAITTTSFLATAFNPVLLPIVVGLALIVAIAGSTPSIRSALRMDPSAILRADA